MPAIQATAYAKLNLTLDVLHRRADGYHDLQMVMQSVALTDHLTVETGVGELRVRTNFSFLPNDEKNLAAAAALRFQEATGMELGGVSIAIEKKIPVCAGMAGGSSDAAAVLRALNDLTGAGLTVDQLAEIGQKVGSDVPYCVRGGTALVEGRGERVTPLPSLPACEVVICKPKFSVSTPELFGRIRAEKIRCRPDTEGMLSALAAGDLVGVARRMYNVFEDVLEDKRKHEVAAVRQCLIAHGALGAVMSGTGPTVFGLFSERVAAQTALEALRQYYRDSFLIPWDPQVQ